MQRSASSRLSGASRRFLPRILTPLYSFHQPITRSFSAKPKVVILGSGWSGFRLAQDLDKKIYDVTVISPRNHFLFTPLLPSTAVGTLEFRCIQEPVRTIPGLSYLQASCNSIDFQSKSLSCTEIFKGKVFNQRFDYLVMAVGSETNTFGVQGVENNSNVFFLKQLDHARAIRNRLIECFERASIKDLDETEKKRLLTFVVVGGGAINIEFASELHDFLTEDVSKWYPDLKDYIRVVVVEASGHILGTFKESLVHYVEKLFISRNIELRTQTTVKEVKNNVAHLGNGETLPFGVMVWSTGIKQIPLIRNLPSLVSKTQGGRVKIDQHLRVLAEISPENLLAPLCDGTVFAIGDCAADSIRPLPTLAQVSSPLCPSLSFLADLCCRLHLNKRNILRKFSTNNSPHIILLQWRPSH
jgi:NADH dehydrogenase FAD-containing subunit